MNAYILLSGNQVSNIAQEFTPQDFWTNREEIAERIRSGVNHTLVKLGYAEVPLVQVLRVDFDQKFEDTITAIQVAEQQKVVNEYQQEVEIWNQKIFNLMAENTARVANITSAAVAQSAEIEATARRTAFHLKQSTKAQSYKELRDALHFNQTEMSRYFQLKSISSVNMDASGPHKDKRIVVGVDRIRD